ncbi:MAG: ubiquinone/menaquinone biosynthesis methyltransferase, partial [Flavobacteriales bacterium]
DISAGMIAVGNKKIQQQKLEKKITLHIADSESIPLSDQSVDVCMVAFGVRNFQDLSKGLKEICRVLRPNGRIVVLEFSKPTVLPVKWLFGFYFKFLMPSIGRLISKDKRAYSYLPESVDAFPSGDAFIHQLTLAGFHDGSAKSLSGGIASIYSGTK